MNKDPQRYHRHRFPPEIISHAVWLYHRFCLSFRDVEDLLAERGVVVSYEAIRGWCAKFGPEYARSARRRRDARAARRFFRRLLKRQQAEPLRRSSQSLKRSDSCQCTVSFGTSSASADTDCDQTTTGCFVVAPLPFGPRSLPLETWTTAVPDCPNLEAAKLT